MSPTVSVAAGASQATTSDRTEHERSRQRDRWLALLKQAMADTGWTVDALAAHYHIHRSYVDRMLDGEKPFSVDRMLELPYDLEGRLEHLRAESFGLIVVKPLTGVDALKALVSGLIGMMSAPQLPARADHMAKADLAPVTGQKAVGE